MASLQGASNIILSLSILALLLTIMLLIATCIPSYISAMHIDSSSSKQYTDREYEKYYPKQREKPKRLGVACEDWSFDFSCIYKMPKYDGKHDLWILVFQATFTGKRANAISLIMDVAQMDLKTGMEKRPLEIGLVKDVGAQFIGYDPQQEMWVAEITKNMHVLSTERGASAEVEVKGITGIKSVASVEVRSDIQAYYKRRENTLRFLGVGIQYVESRVEIVLSLLQGLETQVRLNITVFLNFKNLKTNPSIVIPLYVVTEPNWYPVIKYLDAYLDTGGNLCSYEVSLAPAYKGFTVYKYFQARIEGSKLRLYLRADADGEAKWLNLHISIPQLNLKEYSLNFLEKMFGHGEVKGEGIEVCTKPSAEIYYIIPGDEVGARYGEGKALAEWSFIEAHFENVESGTYMLEVDLDLDKFSLYGKLIDICYKIVWETLEGEVTGIVGNRVDPQGEYVVCKSVGIPPKSSSDYPKPRIISVLLNGKEISFTKGVYKVDAIAGQPYKIEIEAENLGHSTASWQTIAATIEADNPEEVIAGFEGDGGSVKLYPPGTRVIGSYSKRIHSLKGVLIELHVDNWKPGEVHWLKLSLLPTKPEDIRVYIKSVAGAEWNYYFTVSYDPDGSKTIYTDDQDEYCYVIELHVHYPKSPAILVLKAQSTKVRINSTIDIPVVVRGDPSVAGVKMGIVYDPRYLELINVSSSRSYSAYVNYSLHALPNGMKEVVFVWASPKPLGTNEAVIAHIYFNSIKQGIARIFADLSSIELSNDRGTIMEPSKVQGELVLSIVNILMGDLNKNGRYDIGDLVLLEKILLSRSLLGELGLSLSDVDLNKDGNVDIADAVLLAQRIISS